MRATLAFNGLCNDSKSNEGLMPAFKVFTLHAGHCDSSPFFPLKKDAARQFKQNLCWHFNILIGFPHFCVINIIQFHLGGISSDFIWEERKLKKTLNPSRIFDIIFWYDYQPASTLSILLPIITFWNSWTHTQISHFSACRVQLLNGAVLIVLCLLMVVEMTE